MCTTSILEFFIENTSRSEFEGKRVLEVGSKYVNGSIRPFVEKYLKPKEYVGVDVEAGRFVDLVLPVERLATHFGLDSFDVVISTELIEHVLDWRLAISNIKNVVAPMGYVYITTRSRGFRLHAYPYDYWRYEADDIERIFGDFNIVTIIEDAGAPGVFLKARKATDIKTIDLSKVSLYSMLLGKRTKKILNMNQGAFVRKNMQRFLTSKYKNYPPPVLVEILERKYS